MSQLVKYLDDMKAVTGSDYKTAQRAGISRQQVSDLRNGRKGLNPDSILAICRASKLNPAKFEASMNEHLAKTPEAKAAWHYALKSIAASIALAVLLSPLLASQSAGTLYIMLSRKWKNKAPLVIAHC